MARYDGLIIPRSYSEYINKTDAATHVQAHQVNGVLDAEPTENSNKAVKSGGVYDALAGKQPTLTFDSVPTENSSNPVTSNGIYDALGGRSGLSWDSAPTEDSVNPVKSGGVFDALATKQDTLTFDDVPTASSGNPVKSGGVYSASRIELLWENQNTNESFAGQTITAQSIGKDLSQYQAIEIYVKNVIGGGNYTYMRALKDLNTITYTVMNTISARAVTFTNNGIQFSDGWVYNSYGGASATNNNVAVPVKIFGVR